MAGLRDNGIELNTRNKVMLLNRHNGGENDKNKTHKAGHHHHGHGHTRGHDSHHSRQHQSKHTHKTHSHQITSSTSRRHQVTSISMSTSLMTCDVGYIQSGTTCIPIPSSTTDSSTTGSSFRTPTSAPIMSSQSHLPSTETLSSAPTPVSQTHITTSRLSTSTLPYPTSKPSTRQQTNGLDSGWIATIAVVVALGTLLFLGICLLFYKSRRLRARQATQQADDQPRPSSSRAEVRILGRGERAAPLPENNSWNATLQRERAVPQSFRPATHARAYQGEDMGVRDSGCTTLTPKLGRSSDSPPFGPIPGFPAGNHAYGKIRPSSSVYGSMAPSTGRENWWRTADSGAVASARSWRERDGKGSREYEEFQCRGAGRTEVGNEEDEYANGTHTPYAARHIITPYTSGCG